MSILSDLEIQSRVNRHNIIQPFVGEPVSYVDGVGKVVSYGLSSYGYDARVGNTFYIFTDANNGVVDPKVADEGTFVTKEVANHEPLIMPPHSFVLGHSVETFDIPRDVLGICFGKSTYCRKGLIVNLSPLEPSWSGQVTIEISNTTRLPAYVYAGEGIMQVAFFRADRPCFKSYADKAGKYQNQKGVTPGRV